MVSNAVDPRPQGTAGIVLLKAPPQLKKNVLAQVAAFLRVGLVGTHEPFKWGTELLHRLPVQFVLMRASGRYEFHFSHVKDSRWDGNFLTGLRQGNLQALSSSPLLRSPGEDYVMAGRHV
jgi:hypothetical protein